MSIDNYKQYFTNEYLMGPNSLRILNALFEECPLRMNDENLILDLGCGTGLTSFFICKETGAKVLANDLWVDGAENARRFEKLGVGNMITPIQENANDLRFERETFDAIVSVDSYHYFAGMPGYFTEKILPFIKHGGVALIGIPGIKNEFDDRTKELLTPWLGDEAYMFKSPRQWEMLIEFNTDIENVKVWEMSCFDRAWNEWLALDNEYASGDKEYFESIIKPYSNFVGIKVIKR